MEWLSQNWIWLAFAVGMVLMMRRGGAGGCCGMHAAHERHPAGDVQRTGRTADDAAAAGPGDQRAATEAASAAPAAGGCCGGHGSHGQHAASAGAQAASPRGSCCGGHGHATGPETGAAPARDAAGAAPDRQEHAVRP